MSQRRADEKAKCRQESGWQTRKRTADRDRTTDERQTKKRMLPDEDDGQESKRQTRKGTTNTTADGGQKKRMTDEKADGRGESRGLSRKHSAFGKAVVNYTQHG